MTTYSAIATLSDELSAAGLGDALEALGPNGVGVFEIEDGSGRWEVGAYFLDKPDVVALELLAAAYGAAPFAVSAIEDVDWVAQVRRELTPVRAGRFIVHGGHDRERIPVNALSLEIEAAMAFGTGHHGTTEGCLTLLDRLHKLGLRARGGSPISAAAPAFWRWERRGCRSLGPQMWGRRALSPAISTRWRWRRRGRISPPTGCGGGPPCCRRRASATPAFGLAAVMIWC